MLEKVSLSARPHLSLSPSLWLADGSAASMDEHGFQFTSHYDCDEWCSHMETQADDRGFHKYFHYLCLIVFPPLSLSLQSLIPALCFHWTQTFAHIHRIYLHTCTCALTLSFYLRSHPVCELHHFVLLGGGHAWAKGIWVCVCLLTGSIINTFYIMTPDLWDAYCLTAWWGFHSSLINWTKLSNFDSFKVWAWSLTDPAGKYTYCNLTCSCPLWARPSW